MANQTRNSGKAQDKEQAKAAGADSQAQAKNQAQAKTEAPKQEQTQAESQGDNKNGKVEVLRVSCKRERFRRAGFEFGRNETTLRLADLSDDQVKAIKAEPMLVVHEGTEE